ncbi:hypothetical protein ACFQV4_35540 [Streptomyces thermocarboxydus]
MKCSGKSCAGKDAEVMGCSGDLVTTAAPRSSAPPTSRCATARSAPPRGAHHPGRAGDTVEITSGTSQQTDSVDAPGDTVAYTMMVPVASATDAKACVVLAATGEKGCTD